MARKKVDASRAALPALRFRVSVSPGSDIYSPLAALQDEDRAKLLKEWATGYFAMVRLAAAHGISAGPVVNTQQPAPPNKPSSVVTGEDLDGLFGFRMEEETEA